MAGKNGPVNISVIVPAFNEAKLITDTLRRIQAAAVAFSERGWECEWIVCDNNSTDQTAALARAAGAQVVFEPVNQIARARNTGARAATGDWLLFVDADSHPRAELLAEVANLIQSGICLAGGSTVEMEGAQGVGRRFVHIWNWISRKKRWLAGSFIFCEADAFRQVGGFSQEFYASEEIDLSIRLGALARQRGKQIRILDRHPVVTSARKLNLYTHREHWRFIIRTVLSSGRSLRHRQGCTLWYDGRR